MGCADDPEGGYNIPELKQVETFNEYIDKSAASMIDENMLEQIPAT